jgi:folate-dependent phosphoribosylglycinamide formyltransferase PurN
MGVSQGLSSLKLDSAAGDVRARVAIVTNGNYFANIALSHLLERTATTYDYRVYVTRGLRRQQGNRLVEVKDLIGRWGVRYSLYKVATYALPMLAQLVLRRPFFVSALAKQFGVPVEVVRNINDDAVAARLRAFAPDILLSHSCPYRIGNEVLSIPTVGSLNVHSSLLPRYAGVGTYVHVLADGETSTGVTVHEMVERFDAGRIVEQREIAIADRTSVFALFSEQSRLAGPMLVDALATCVRLRTIPGVAQDAARRTYHGEPKRADIARLRTRGHRLMRMCDVAALVRTKRTAMSPSA